MSGSNPEFPRFVPADAYEVSDMVTYTENLSLLPQALQIDVLNYKSELTEHNARSISFSPFETDYVTATGFNQTVVSPERLWLEGLRDNGAPISFSPAYIGSTQIVATMDQAHAEWFDYSTHVFAERKFPNPMKALSGVIDTIALQGDHIQVANAGTLGRSALGEIIPQKQDRELLENRVFMTGLVAKAAVTAHIMVVANISSAALERYAQLSDAIASTDYEEKGPLSIPQQATYIQPAVRHLLNTMPPYQTTAES